MPDVNMQPLRDLLATHPEECAAVVAALIVAGVTKNGQTLARVASLSEMTLDADVAQRILEALVDADLVAPTHLPGAVLVYLIRGAEPARATIARIGAAAWLREKCPRTDKHRGFDLSNARLHEIAADAMRSAVSEDDRAIAYKVRAVADGAVPFAAIDYRGCLMAMVKRGARLDVDAEVAAVWGKAEKDGEQR